VAALTRKRTSLQPSSGSMLPRSARSAAWATWPSSHSRRTRKLYHRTWFNYYPDCVAAAKGTVAGRYLGSDPLAMAKGLEKICDGLLQSRLNGAWLVAEFAFCLFARQRRGPQGDLDPLFGTRWRSARHVIGDEFQHGGG